MRKKCDHLDVSHHHNNNDHHQHDNHNATTLLLTATSTSTLTTQRHRRSPTARPPTLIAHEPAEADTRPARQVHQSSRSYYHLDAPRHTSRATPHGAEQLDRTRPPIPTLSAAAPQDHQSHQHLSLSRCSHHHNGVTATGHEARTSHASQARPRLQHHHRRRHQVTTVTDREHPTTNQADARQQLSRLSHQRS